MSPAKLAPTPVPYVPALIPDRLALASVATPLPLVVALPTELPLRVKLMVLPLTPEAPEVKVADKLTVPPYVPLAELTDRLVACPPMTSVPVPSNEVLAVFVPRTVNVYVPDGVDAVVLTVSVEFGDELLTVVVEKEVVTPAGAVPVQPTKLKVTGSPKTLPLPL